MNSKDLINIADGLKLIDKKIESLKSKVNKFECANFISASAFNVGTTAEAVISTHANIEDNLYGQLNDLKRHIVDAIEQEISDLQETKDKIMERFEGVEA